MKAVSTKAVKAISTEAVKAGSTEAVKAISTAAVKADSTKAMKADSTVVVKADNTEAVKAGSTNVVASDCGLKPRMLQHWRVVTVEQKLDSAEVQRRMAQLEGMGDMRDKVEITESWDIPWTCCKCTYANAHQEATFLACAACDSRRTSEVLWRTSDNSRRLMSCPFTLQELPVEIWTHEYNGTSTAVD